MVDLGLNQYKIKEIKYEVKEGKTVIFKLNHFDLEDVIIETNDEKIKQSEEPDYHPFSESEDYKSDEKKQDDVFSLDNLNNYGPAKHLDDYKPVNIFRGEKGMQETLEASRHKNWRKSFKENPPKKPTKTGNALFPNDDNVATKDLKYSYKDFCASTNEIANFLKQQKHRDLNEDIRFRDKHEKKLVKDLVNAKKLIDNYTTKMSAVEKERFADRVKEKYFKLDPNDEYSKIKSLGSIDTSKTEFVEFLKDKPYMPAISKEFLEKNGMKHVGTMKVETESGKIIEFKPNKDNEKSEE